MEHRAVQEPFAADRVLVVGVGRQFTLAAHLGGLRVGGLPWPLLNGQAGEGIVGFGSTRGMGNGTDETLSVE
jgi:hypothetical protein